MKIVVIFFLCFCITTAEAQQTVVATGGTALGSGGTVTYSIGQVFYTTNAGAIGTVNQGVQHPYEISVLLGIDNNAISLSLEIYPNPTHNFLLLSFGNFDLSNMSFQLFDSKGGLIETKKITSNSQTISLQNLASAIYFLKVINNNKKVKAFKIIKY